MVIVEDVVVVSSSTTEVSSSTTEVSFSTLLEIASSEFPQQITNKDKRSNDILLEILLFMGES